MQIPPIDRTPSQRSTSANAVFIVAARVNPVAQVSQTVHATPTPAPAPTPSVINMVNMANVERAVSAGLATNLPEPVNPPNVPGALSPVSELKASKESAKPDAASLVERPNAANTADKSNAGEGAFTSVSDPARRGSEAATGQKDWTIHRPKPEKVEDPPPVPMSKVLIDHVKQMWAAGASAIQAQQIQNLQEPVQATQNPLANPGVLAKEVFTYTPSKIKKTEEI